MEDRHHSLLKPAIDPSLEMSDADLFWQDHWKKFVWGLGAVVALILASGAWMFYTSQQRNSAEALYSLADAPEAWRNVIDRYPGSTVAGDARLRLASALRAQGDLGGASSELEALVNGQPDHPLAGAAWLALGEIREAQGKPEEALQCYRESSSRYKESYAAPLAMIAEARSLASQGRPGEAKSLLESIAPAYPDSPAAMVAQSELTLFAPPQAQGQQQQPSQPVAPQAP